LRDRGRVGVRALMYFEAVSTFALLVGLVVVNVVGPGRGMNVDPATLDTRSIQSYTAAARHESVADFLLNLIPASVVDALARNEILQVLLFSILLGVALARLRERAEPLAAVLAQIMRKLENVGCSRAVVGLVVPSGLAFNPDGQCIYYTLAAVFVAQATNTPLTLADQLLVLGVLMLTSKGSAGVTGSGFIT